MKLPNSLIRLYISCFQYNFNDFEAKVLHSFILISILYFLVFFMDYKIFFSLMKFIRFNEILIKWYIGVKTNWRNNQNRVQLYPDWYQKSDENCAINNYTRLQEWMCSKCYGGKLEGILKQSLLVIIEDRRGSRKKVFQYKRRSYLSQQEASDISRWR